MIDAWIVIREEKHIETKHWVCLSRDDALKIAIDVEVFWRRKYEPADDQVYTDICEDEIFHVQVEDSYRVYVHPQVIIEQGEIDK